MKKEIVWNSEKIARLWSFYSENPNFSSSYFSSWAGKHVLKRANRFIDFQGKCVLDYGCGTGHIIPELLKFPNTKVFGLDSSESSINQVNEKYSSNHQFLGAFHTDDFVSHIPEESVDILIALEIIEHLDDNFLEIFYTQIAKLLKLRGYVVITTPNNENLEKAKMLCPECGTVYHKWQHVRSWNKNILRSSMERNGLELITLEETCWGSPARKMLHLLRSIKDRVNPMNHIFCIGRKR